MTTISRFLSPLSDTGV